MYTVSLLKPSRISDWMSIYLLYRKVFPASERKPFFVIWKMFRQHKTDLWCILQKKHFVGFAATVNSPQLVLLDYLAICPRHQKNGLGSTALHKLQQHYSGRGLFVEIESTTAICADLSQRLRRKRFYENAGMVPMGVTADVFGVRMELLGWNCFLRFEDYRNFYHDHYSSWAADHILP